MQSIVIFIKQRAVHFGTFQNAWSSGPDRNIWVVRWAQNAQLRSITAPVMRDGQMIPSVASDPSNRYPNSLADWMWKAFFEKVTNYTKSKCWSETYAP